MGQWGHERIDLLIPLDGVVNATLIQGIKVMKNIS